VIQCKVVCPCVGLPSSDPKMLEVGIGVEEMMMELELQGPILVRR
jgi:hypothetical protein